MATFYTAVSGAALALSLSAGLGVAPGGGAWAEETAPELDQWDPAQVVDARPGVADPSGLLSTARGRAGVVYVVGGDVWASSRPEGPDHGWDPPTEILPAPDDGSAGPVVAGPVAVGRGATVFLSSGLGATFYAQLTPRRHWTDARPFPFRSTFVPDVALVRPHTGIVAVGAGGLGGRVHVAEKPQGARWRMSPALPLDGRKLVRGAWYDSANRVHVLVARKGAGSRSAHREMYTAMIRDGRHGPSWGRVRQVPRGTDGALAALDDVSMVADSQGGLTVLWRESDEGTLRQYVRHRDLEHGWSPAQLLPFPALGLPVVATLDGDGTTRLAYVTASTEQGDAPYALVTRLMSDTGALGDEEVLDTVESGGIHLDAATGELGDVLLRWRTSTGQDEQQRLFRCIHQLGCQSVGSVSGTPELELALAPDGTGYLAGVGAVVPGCPAGALCTRRLPPPTT